jgi:hypothetical protein
MAEGPALTRVAYRIMTALRGENGNRILGDLGITRDKRETFELRLCNEESIERIAMVERKRPRCPRMLGGDRQRGEPSGEVAHDVLDRRTKLAGAMLDRDLPDRGGTHRHDVLRLIDGRASFAGQRWVVDERPDDDVRVEKEPQPRASGGKMSLS